MTSKSVLNLQEFSICLLLFMLTFFIFLPALNHQFVNFDDNLYVKSNPWVQAGLKTESLKWAFTSTWAGNWHPLTWISHMLDVELFGMDAGLHHLGNIFFHIANTLLLFLILNGITHAPWRSAFVAAVFALHPLHVESVAWVSERKDVLSTFFWLLTIGAYVNYVTRPKISNYSLILIAFSFGLMTKAMLVTLPYVLLLMDFWPLARFTTKKPNGDVSSPTPVLMQAIPRLILEKVPLIALTIPIMIIAMIAQSDSGAIADMQLIPLSERFANALIAYVWYIWKMILPFNLSVFYPHPGMWPVWQVLFACLILVLFSIAVFRWWRYYPYLPVGWLWYLGTLVPVIGLVQIGSQAMADRYTYIPLIGLFIMIAWGGSDLFKHYQYRRFVLGLLTSIVLVGSMMITRDQLSYWQNSISLFQRNIAVTSSTRVSHYNIGLAYRDIGNYDEAILHFRKALSFNHDMAAINNNLGVTYILKGELSQASEEFKAALRHKPDHAGAHNNLAMALYRQDKLGESILHFREAIKIQPEYANAHFYLAEALDKTGKREEASSHYALAVKINPDFGNMGFRVKQ